MDLNTWAFALSVLGVILGIISAYAQLKTFSLRLIKATGQAAARSSERKHAQADMFLDQPAALIAFVTYRVLLTFLLVGLGSMFLKSGAPLFLDLPVLLVNLMRFGLAGICANLMTSSLMVSWQVYRRAVSRAARDS